MDSARTRLLRRPFCGGRLTARETAEAVIDLVEAGRHREALLAIIPPFPGAGAEIGERGRLAAGRGAAPAPSPPAGEPRQT